MSDSKIQFKIGIIEFSGEGNQDWLALQLDKILDKVPELVKIEMPIASKIDPGDATKNEVDNSTMSSLSVLNIAGKLSSKSGGDLVIAAAAYLHFVKGKTSFTREDITTNMKKATGIHKNSFLANLTTTLAGLEKNGALLKNGNSYSLNAKKVNELNAILSK
jgi:hypothetical protein